MNSITFRRHARLGTALAAMAISLGTLAVAAPAPAAAAQSARPSETLNLSQNTGTLVRLTSPMSDLFVANDSIADVQVRSSTQLYVFGKSAGETTVYATDKSGRVVYAANVRVGTNLGSVDEMLRLAMPEASIQATPMNNLVLLTGTVGSPDDVSEAQRLVQAYVGTDFENYYSEFPHGEFGTLVWVNNAQVAALCIALGVLGLPVAAIVAASSTGITIQMLIAPVAHSAPQKNSSGSPGRKNRGRNAISVNTMANRTA